MTQLILPRRRFLFMAPAIVAASSLMPGHSIAKLLAVEPEPEVVRPYYIVYGGGSYRVAYGADELHMVI